MQNKVLQLLQYNIPILDNYIAAYNDVTLALTIL